MALSTTKEFIKLLLCQNKKFRNLESAVHCKALHVHKMYLCSYGNKYKYRAVQVQLVLTAVLPYLAISVVLFQSQDLLGKNLHVQISVAMATARASKYSYSAVLSFLANFSCFVQLQTFWGLNQKSKTKICPSTQMLTPMKNFKSLALKTCQKKWSKVPDSQTQDSVYK